jgi:uncharacterized protein (TIRG00374 family)
MNRRLKQLKESKILWYGVSTLILIGLVYAADLGDVIDALQKVDPLYMAGAFFFGLSVFLVWGYIWHSFFKKMDINRDIFKSYKIFMAGHFMNSITPLGQLGGEPFMAYVISENTDSTYQTALSSVISADLINALPIIIYTSAAVIYLFFAGTAHSIVIKAAYLVIISLAMITVISYMIFTDGKSLGNWITSFLELIGDRSERLKKYTDSLKERVAELRESFRQAAENPSHLVKMVAVAHLAMPTQFICLYLILLGLGVEPTLTGIILTIILAGFAMFSPTPGGSGTFEAAFSGLLLVFYPSIGLKTAVAAAILFRLTTYWPGIPIGYTALINLRRDS